MILVVATMCLVDKPAVCRQHEWLMAGDYRVLSACQIRPNPQMIEWLDKNPEWKVKAWKCTDPIKDL